MASPDAVLVFNGSQIGLISNGDGTYALQTSGSGASGGGTASVTSVAGSATSVQLLASNAARTGFRAFNDSSAVCYVKYGTTASTSDYTVQLLPGGYLEESQYSGRVDGIWASATGAMKLTELS